MPAPVNLHMQRWNQKGHQEPRCSCGHDNGQSRRNNTEEVLPQPLRYIAEILQILFLEMHTPYNYNNFFKKKGKGSKKKLRVVASHFFVATSLLTIVQLKKHDP